MSITNEIEKMTQLFAKQGMTISGSKQIAYGVQLQVSKNNETIPVSIYSGKKGISVTVGGSASSALKLVIQKALLLNPSNADGEPHGFEAVEDFGGCWIGTDESGKGDFFGPLVVAAVGVDADLADQLAVSGIKDCKVLSDIKVRQLANTIRNLCAGKYVELEMSPAKYNSLYKQMEAEGKNLNHLLAWAHARAIEDLLNVMPCRFAIADQFANEAYIQSRLMQRGRQIVLVQTHKAERNIAVAAASVLARDRFLGRMEELGQRFGISLPKGASPAVVDAGKKFIAYNGVQTLGEVCKLHFKTVSQVISEGE